MRDQLLLLAALGHGYLDLVARFHAEGVGEQIGLLLQANALWRGRDRGRTGG